MKKIIWCNPNHFGNLHCDSCGYDLPVALQFGPHLIGTPCPMCSANMLTLRDYQSTVRLFRRIDWLNRWFGWLGRENPTAKDETLRVKIHDNTMTIRKQ